jgi:hypothetical protein
MSLMFFVVLFPLISGNSEGHLAVWTEAMFGSEPGHPNSNHAVEPLQDMTFNEWWWHGDLDKPPKDGVVFNLPANGQAEVEIADNKAWTSMGQGLRKNPRQAPVPWTNEQNGWGCKYHWVASVT